jgi:hypothetical protein
VDLSGEEFYRYFFCKFQDYVRVDRKKYEKAEKDPEWTQYVKDNFLAELAKALGFDKIKTEGIHGIDLHWERSSDGMSIAIEHENIIDLIWDDEVLNLLMAEAPLKILITYVKDAEFPGKDIADRLFDLLRKRGFLKEFLLVLGTWSMNEPTDWTAYLFRPELTLKNLVVCSTTLEAEKKPQTKAWITRRKGKK